jgi:hypothetical protein
MTDKPTKIEKKSPILTPQQKRVDRRVIMVDVEIKCRTDLKSAVCLKDLAESLKTEGLVITFQ